MAIPTLRDYLGFNGGHPANGVRAAALPLRQISVRSLLTAPRIIHISDLHFTDKAHTWDVGGPLGIMRDDQNSSDKSSKLELFLKQRRSDFGTTRVVITGDLTDSGGDHDYSIAQGFISGLAGDGFQVSVIPGNHDYCWEGLLCVEDVFKAVLAISEAEISAAVTLAVGALIFDPDPISAAAAAAAATTSAIAGLVTTTIASTLAASFPGLSFPAEFIADVAALFTLACPIVAATTDTVDNSERRRRFLHYVAPGQTDYPMQVDVPGGALLLLDFMRDELDGLNRDAAAQGRLGALQLAKLQSLVTNYQSDRAQGKKLAVCLHHSPLHTSGPNQGPLRHDDTSGLDDAQELFSIIAGRVDGLLFGHTSPAGVDQQPRPSGDTVFSDAETTFQIMVLNCENLEHIGTGPKWPVTVVDLGSGKRATYDAFAPADDPVLTWGTAPP